GMTVFGPRRRALAIPSSTIDRAVEQLLAKGHVARGYLGAGLQHVRLPRAAETSTDHARGILVVSIDPEGPAASAGLLVGDIITKWNGEPVASVREVMRRLGPQSAGANVDLQLLRGGRTTNLTVTLGERPLT